jgi:hypothetical protein
MSVRTDFSKCLFLKARPACLPEVAGYLAWVEFVDLIALLKVILSLQLQQRNILY